jgi:hypothetical protein
MVDMNTKIFNYKDKSVMFMNYDLDYCYKVADYMIKRPDTKGYWRPRLFEEIYDWIEISDDDELVPVTAEEIERAYNELR